MLSKCELCKVKAKLVKNNEKWVEGYLTVINDTAYITTDGKEKFEVLKESVCRKIGITDNFNNDIFEYDVVDAWIGKVHGNFLAVWDKQNFAYTFIFLDRFIIKLPIKTIVKDMTENIATFQRLFSVFDHPEYLSNLGVDLNLNLS